MADFSAVRQRSEAVSAAPSGFCYADERMDVEGLTPAELEWLTADEALWQRAHRIAAQNSELDPSDVYHTLRNFQRSPSERLRRGLRHGRTRTRTI